MQELISTIEKLPPELCEFIKSNENWELYYIGILQIAFDKKNKLAGASDWVYHHNLWCMVKRHFNDKKKVDKMEEQINDAIQKKTNSGIRDLFYYPEDRLKEEFLRIKGNYIKRGISKDEITKQIWILFDKLKVNHIGNGDQVINFSLSNNYVALGSFTGWVEKEFGDRLETTSLKLPEERNEQKFKKGQLQIVIKEIIATMAKPLILGVSVESKTALWICNKIHTRGYDWVTIESVKVTLRKLGYVEGIRK